MEPHNIEPQSQNPLTPAPGSQFVDYSKSVPGPLGPSPVIKARHSSKGLWISIFIILLVLLVAGVVFAYDAFADKTVMKTLSGIDFVPKAHAVFSLELVGTKPPLAGSRFDMVSDVDRSSPDIRLQSNLVLTAPGMGASVDLKIIGTTLYIRANAIPAAYGSLVPTSVVGEWHSISFDALNQLQSSYGVASTTSWLDPRQHSLAGIYDTLRSLGVLSEPNFVGIALESGELVRRYSFKVSKEALGALVSNDVAQKGGKQYIETAQNAVGTYLNIFEVSPIIVSISLFSGELKQISGMIMIAPEFKNNSQGVEGLRFALSYEKNAESFVIEEPTGAVPLDTFINATLAEAREKAKLARVRVLIASVRPMAEIHHDAGNSYVGMCKAQSIAAVSVDLQSQGYTPLCRESKAAYLYAVPVMSTGTTTKTYICADSKGNFKDLPKLLSGYVCK